MTSPSRLLALFCLVFIPAAIQEDVEDVPCEDLKAGGDKDKRYFLIGGGKGVAPPAGGFKLAIIMPGGDGSAEFNPFVKRIWKHALSKEYLVAQPVSVEWKLGQFNTLVWPTKKNPADGMKFTTEDFVETVIREVAKKHKVDPRCIFTLSWSSGGPPAYFISLQEKRLVTGSFISQSVFHVNQLPALKAARGFSYYLHHSPTDPKCPIEDARKAREELGKQGAKVELVEYEGGHGWKGDVFGQIRKGFEWLEKNASAPPKRK